MSGRFPLVLSYVGLLATVACSGEAASKQALARGEALLRVGKNAEAIIELLNAAEGNQRSGETRLRLAEAYAANGDPENAFRQYVRAADLLPDDNAVQVTAATYLLVASQFEDARTRAERLLAKDPANIDALIILGNALAHLRDPEGAVAQLNEAIQLDPGRGPIYTNLALVEVARGKYDAASDAFEKAVQTDPESVPARLALASFQWALNDVDATRGSLEAALRLNPQHVITHRALAVFYRATGHSAEAEEHLTFVAANSTAPEAQLELADYYISERRPVDARKVLEPLTTRAATLTAAQTRLAALSYMAGQQSSGHQLVDQVLAREPNYALALMLRARWLMSEGQTEEALDFARAAVAASPRVAAAHYIRGQVEVRTHRTSDAIKSFTEVLRLNPRAASAQVQLSNLHLMRNSVDSAVLLADEAIRNAPRNVDGYLARIRAWVARGDLVPARQALAAIVKQLPDSGAVSALEGRLHMRAGDAVAARAAFERTLQLDPRAMEALEGLTMLDLQQHQIDAAHGRMASLLDAGDGTPAALLLAARVFLAKGDRPRAEALLRKSIARDPLDTANYALLGRLLQEDERFDVARVEFASAAERDPQNISARMMLGLIAHVQGDVAQAKHWYSEVLRIEPRAALAANNLASIYADAGENLDVAQKLAESAIDQWPAAAEFQDTLGWIYYRRQLGGPAITRFQQSIATDPSNPVYHYHLGLAYFRNGDRDRARTALRRALELNSSYADARQALVTVER